MRTKIQIGWDIPANCLLGFPLLLLPTILGGARPWLWSAVAALFFVCLAFLVWKNLVPMSWEAARDKRCIIVGLLLLYPFLQLLPLPVSWLALLSPHRALWLEAALRAAGGAPPRAVAISYGTLTTFFAECWWIFLAAFSLLFRSTIQSEKGLERFLGFLCVIGMLESFYGLLQVLVPNLGVLWEQDSSGVYAGIARGTFINRNHYAAFLGMIWPILLSYVMSLNIPERMEASCAGHDSRVMGDSKSRQKQFFLIFVIGMVLLTLIFSMSRGGILGALIALTVLIVFGRGAQRKKMVLSLAACWIIVFSYGVAIGLDGIVERFEKLSDDAPSRLEIWEDSWHIIQDHPLTGVGMGNNALVFDIYQSHFPDNLHASHAHNDYLQLATELGLPAALMISLLVWGFWWRTAWIVKTTRFDTSGPEERRRLIRLGALAATAAFLCHCWVEFNWQIPANQLYFIALLVLMGSNPIARRQLTKTCKDTAHDRSS